MIGFFFKKNFYDGWDNLVWIVVFNLIILAISAAGLYLLQSVFTTITIIAVPIFILFVCLDFIMLFAVSEGCANLVDYKSSPYRETFSYIKDVWKIATLFGLLISIVIILVALGIPFYLSYGNFVGLSLAFFIFWAALVIVLALQWFLPLYSQLHGGFLKTLKKSFILLFDNTGFSLLLFFYSIFMMIFSVILIFVVPGTVGICMAQNNALKLRMKKYDWLEAHPEIIPSTVRKQIPWEEILDEDKEIVGNRTLKNLIFPWKD
ncbi:MAG: hypothetical protein BKP49_04045 [Treponema sp. CETP13]|nr:MAG: hypothetical protein BKP49_04045 [Treponema sp. CETP13]